MLFRKARNQDEIAAEIDRRGKMDALERSQALIEFDLEGNVLMANANFLAVMGYQLSEIQGRPHAMFVEPDLRDSREYRDFWARLRRGEFVNDLFKRVGNHGKTVYVLGSYNPVLGPDGKPIKILKYAIDVTAIEERRHEQLVREHESAAVQEKLVGVLAEGLGKLAEGDLRYRATERFPDAYERLRTDLNGAFEQLCETMKIVGDNAAALRTGTQEITTASDDLSRRTEQQAASLEETAAALGEITSTVRKTSEGAKHARDVVSVAKKDAEHSGEVVRRAVEAMGEIEKSSGQIGQIIGVIDEIAFQTNLLALNAGVEAARAGDAGRGFAVVASEVRALAQRSAEAAKEIKALINTSSQQVSTGVSLVGQTGKSLEGIAAQIGEINEVVTVIAASAVEQATALDQINTAVVQMDQVTQQNAAMVEEATAASHNLAHETEQLARLVDRFQTGRSPATPAPAKRPAARQAPVAAMKTVGRGGGAVRKPAPVASAAEESWEEF